MRDTGAGEIVLVHDIHASTIAAMPATLDGLLARKFQFVTVSQLIAMESTGVADNTTPPAVAGEGAVTADPVPEVKPLPSADPAAGTADVE